MSIGKILIIAIVAIIALVVLFTLITQAPRLLFSEFPGFEQTTNSTTDYTATNTPTNVTTNNSHSTAGQFKTPTQVYVIDGFQQSIAFDVAALQAQPQVQVFIDQQPLTIITSPQTITAYDGAQRVVPGRIMSWDAWSQAHSTNGLLWTF